MSNPGALDAMAFWITDSEIGSSSGGDAFHLSIGVMESTVLVIRGEPARGIALDDTLDDCIFCFCRRRALANQVVMRF